MSELCVFGASGHAKVLIDIALLTGFDEIRLYDDRYQTIGQLMGLPVIGNWSDFLLAVRAGGQPAIAIGSNRIRERKLRELRQHVGECPSLIHPSAVISKYANLGPGVVVMANAVVNSSAIVGRGSILNTSSSVDHDCNLGEFVHLSPGARLAGNVTVGDRSWVGMNAAIREGVVLGRDVVVGAGAVVLQDVPDNLTVAGVPARTI